MTHEELLQTVAASPVSDAAKEFFQKHRVATGTNLGRAGGWGEEYPLLRELEEAGFIVTYVHFPDSVCNWGSDMESPGTRKEGMEISEK